MRLPAFRFLFICCWSLVVQSMIEPKAGPTAGSGVTRSCSEEEVAKWRMEGSSFFATHYSPSAYSGAERAARAIVYFVMGGRPALGKDFLVALASGDVSGLFMLSGFRPYAKEWWHFTLSSEPFPETYFDFSVR